ncbi:phage portal protein [Mycetocola tolaasinivorans]|uniref:Phage portal protein n=1 Tax=Mycetocola tolaasinivorans TaxID=76635 RepID=A0A3L7A8E5_9MICO|nr:phage portal protein [Mycetocola tolaasinivorans]RLP76324.1 phage portal protein [Mycetocola tolaasinivorans]
MDANEALRLVNRCYARLNGRRGEMRVREEYYEGKQPLNFATAEWKKANSARYANFADNWCQPVADAEAERIAHTGIKIAGTNGKAAAQKLWEAWLRNEMQSQSSQGFLTSLVTSRSFVTVWGDENDEPLISWEHPDSVEIEYDWERPGRRTAALKTWVDESKEYATLYESECVWKFERALPKTTNDRESQATQAKVGVAHEGGWVPRIPRGDDVWPIWNPMGTVPVVEVPNRPMLGGDPRSEISGVIAMQDTINLLWAYLLLAADYASMDARVVLGQGPPMMPILDKNGVKIGEKPVDIGEMREKRMLYLTNPDAKIDSWNAAALDTFTETIEIAVGHIAAQTRTPPTYLVTRTGMSNVNGEGLKASEIGLVKKVIEFTTFATPAMREVHRLVALAMGDTALAEQVRLATMTWMNPEIRSEAQLADSLTKKKAIGYPLRYLMELDGLDPLEIDRVMEMHDDEQRDVQLEEARKGLRDIVDPYRDEQLLLNAADDSGGNSEE